MTNHLHFTCHWYLLRCTKRIFKQDNYVDLVIYSAAFNMHPIPLLNTKDAALNYGAVVSVIKVFFFFLDTLGKKIHKVCWYPIFTKNSPSIALAVMLFLKQTWNDVEKRWQTRCGSSSQMHYTVRSHHCCHWALWEAPEVII